MLDTVVEILQGLQAQLRLVWVSLKVRLHRDRFFLHTFKKNVLKQSCLKKKRVCMDAPDITANDVVTRRQVGSGATRSWRSYSALCLKKHKLANSISATQNRKWNWRQLPTDNRNCWGFPSPKYQTSLLQHKKISLDIFQESLLTRKEKVAAGSWKVARVSEKSHHVINTAAYPNPNPGLWDYWHFLSPGRYISSYQPARMWGFTLVFNENVNFVLFLH